MTSSSFIENLYSELFTLYAEKNNYLFIKPSKNLDFYKLLYKLFQNDL